ncbi:hypothetical protein JYK00_09270 [Thermosipho ferrireducens]|uniref:Septum formation initiator n=1 Tax=Thermosipho ferrireducens TaxID=2571116 RepID=A0ABX7S963_9BACT|nr:hypothetical protein [Thermosipho ferrireducens]QTA37893.1 hypothetical protein JYK00_09270 [Thermosipho ferrireducens]
MRSKRKKRTSKTYQKRNNHKKNKFGFFLYILLVTILSLFLFVTLISSYIRYKINLKEVENLKEKYETLSKEYQRKLALYQRFQKIAEEQKEKEVRKELDTQR